MELLPACSIPAHHGEYGKGQKSTENRFDRRASPVLWKTTRTNARVAKAKDLDLNEQLEENPSLTPKAWDYNPVLNSDSP